MDDRKFTLKKVTKFKDAEGVENLTLPVSDLCLTTNELILQFDYTEAEAKKEEISPGVYCVNSSDVGAISLVKTELREEPLLQSIDNTHRIKKEVEVFFKKLPIYEELGISKSRKILLYSEPGCGKTAAINRVIKDLINEDSGTVAMIWPTNKVRSSDFKDFLSLNTFYSEKCTRVVITVEDIGGGEYDGPVGGREIDSGLLNFLDGVDLVFKLPTFIIATTNYPQNLLGALADRPGRFDQMIELKPPSYDEKIALMEFISKKSLTQEEKDIFNMKDAQNFSIAHLKEIITRSMLHDKTYFEVAKDMIEHTTKFKNDFQKAKTLGIKNWDD